MSNRDSMGFGDLLPQDVVDIFAQEKLGKKGHKQRSRSFGRALGWLKGKKHKHVREKGQNPGLGPAFDLAVKGHPHHQGVPKGALKFGKQGHQQSNSHAAPKRDDNDERTPAPLVLQENVFIEASRPKYLEDLHSEALEGLKLMQQEERIIGPEYPDNESTISTVSARAELDGGGFTTDSTLPDTSSAVSVQSSVSSRSTRSGLTRQGSTFRPLKPDKGRTKRRHRKTIGGIPQHLQREFGLDRAEWTVSPQLEEEFVNGDSDMPQLGVQSSPEAENAVLHPLSNVQVDQPGAAHVDDLALLQRLGTGRGDDRPWSLAVPGMTTAGSGQPGPPSPVMSMSPQAAYLSKIIPNAVLPPSIEVVEISRGNSRNSVRTVSKSSLMMSSPTSSRASSRASTARSTSSRSSTITSASRHNHFHLSDSSCWSNSDSDTLVSDSSTISSGSNPQRGDVQDKAVSKKQNKVNFHTNSPKSSSNGKIKGNESKKDGPFVRSLSVMKSKRAPPPPSRSYSLHNKMKRRSRDLADVRIIPSQTPEESMKKKIDSPGYNADTSSLDEFTVSKTPSPLKSQQNAATTQNSVSTEGSNAHSDAPQAKVISPSSGYSSQDATSPKSPPPTHKKGLLAKLHKLFPVIQPEVHNAPDSTVSDTPSVKALRELFTIPPHPKVRAPPPPPPEVWSHNPRSIELLLGPPAPGNTYAIVKKNPKDKRPYRQPASTAAEGTVRGEEQKSLNSITAESKKVSQEGSPNVVQRTNDCERLIQENRNVKAQSKVQVSEIITGVLVRNTDRDADRLPAIAEEHKTTTQTTKNPSISSAHTSPRFPIRQAANAPPVISIQHVVSPESSWPPPPPPVSQAGLGSPEETDFPLPPPPNFTEAEVVLPVQVPLDKPAQPVQGTASPLNIPPPPSYTAPPPPIKTFPEKVKPFCPQSKDVAPPPKITPSPRKEVTPKVSQSTNDSSAPVQNLSTVPPPPKAPPSSQKKLLMDIISSKIIHTPSTKPSPSPPHSEPLPPPDLIPPTPSREVLVVTAIERNLTTPQPSQAPLPLFKDVPQRTETASLESTEPTTSQSVITNTNSPSGFEIKAKAISPPPQTVLKLPAESVSSPDHLEVILPSKAPAAPSGVTSTHVKVLLPPAEVALIPGEVSNPPEASPLPRTEATQSPAEIHKPAEESVTLSESTAVEEVSGHQSLSPQTEVLIQKIKLISPQPLEEVRPAAPAAPEEASILSPVAASTPDDVPEVVPTPCKETLKDTSSEKVSVEAAESPVTKDSPPSAVNEIFLPVVVDVSYPQLSEESSTDALEDSQKPPRGDDVSPAEDVSNILPNNDAVLKSDAALQTETKLSDEEILPDTDSILPPGKSSLTPPQSIPPPPPAQTIPDTLPAHQPNQLNQALTQPIESSVILSQPEPLESNVIPSEPEPLESTIILSQPEAPPNEPSSAQDEAVANLLPPPQNEEPPKQAPASDAAEHQTKEQAQALTAEAPSPAPSEEIPEPVPASDNAESQSQAPSQAPITEEVSLAPSEEIPKPVPSSDNAEIQSQGLITEEVSPAPSEEIPKPAPASDNAEGQNQAPSQAPITEEVSQNANSKSDQTPNATPEIPKTKDEEETTSQPQTSATEAPQKPLRKSLVLNAPLSPPAAATTPSNPTKVPSPSLTSAKSPPAMAPSMNLHEAIRLRTAARSQNGSSRLSIHSPPGFDMRRSPTSTASFIFSRSNKKVVIDARAQAKVEKRTEGPVAKASVEPTTKKELKVPPPVAKKPKPKGKEAGTEDTAQASGQDGHSETIKDNAQKPNGTARTVEGH